MKPRLLAYEAGLYKAKWFDYRPLHHTAATLLFASFYRDEHIRAHAKWFDAESAYPGLSVDHEKIKPADFTSLWKGRQAADSYGIPYGFYIKAAMTAVMREKMYKRVPRPNQLYASHIIQAAAESWDDYTRRRFVMAEDKFYVFDGQEHDDRDEHASWILSQARNRANPQYALSEALGAGFLLPEQIENEFGTATYFKTRALLSI